MRVLFLIPKNPPPQLEGYYSRPFKEFVSLCLNKEPFYVSCGEWEIGRCMKEIRGGVDPAVITSALQRPTAGELLRHKFLRQARKTSYLCELVERFVRWRAEQGEDTPSVVSQDSIE